jgi:hypothetical protein
MPEPTTPLSEEAAKDEAERLIRAAYQPTKVVIEDPAIPSYKDGPRVGNTPPVAQPDSRLVPAWALGVAVGSVGVGAGSIGLGCAVWLACKGLSSVIHSLSSVTLAGVLTVAIPFAGATMLATAIGGAISKAKRAATPEIHHHNGPEYHETRVDNRKSVWSKTINRD